MIALVDCNSFYASCEQIFRVDLRTKPVVVLSNNDGCIVARNKEAKALCIPDLQPYFKVKDLLEKHRVTVFSSNYELYADISSRVVSILREYAPQIEVYSIDESFLLLDGLNEDYRSYAQGIKNTLWRDVRMPVCVGVAASKTLSKLANHIAKKSGKLQGVCVIDDIQRWHPLFKKLPVGRVWGIGSRLSRRLAAIGIHSVYDFKTAPAKRIRQNFGVNLERTRSELNGERCLPMTEHAAAKQCIVSTRSFGEKINNIEGLQQALSQYASQACQKLRKQASLVGRVSIFIETSRFGKNPLHRSDGMQLLYPSNDSRTVIRTVKQLLERIYKPGQYYVRAGVGLEDIIPDSHLQLSLLDSGQSKKSKKLMQTLDHLNEKGLGEIRFASSGLDPFWKMQRRLKSPAYTTHLDDLVSVRMC
ncbi:MAG: Y-family DNA polymerase [gamma proteobacterium symbiont of Bathyaustriella thionipta]|nr:Y-family DNA polymerase [gamma proteobacterium symbiont of Bathyaustriella thionipta]